jgi:hypothetical protein
LCNSVGVRGQISIESTVHICSGPFHHTNSTHLESIHIYHDIFPVLSLFTSIRHEDSPHSGVPIEQIREPGLHIRTLPTIRRQVSILVPAATIENQPTPHRFLLGRLQQNPVRSTKIATCSPAPYCRGLTDGNVAIIGLRTPPTSQAEIPGIE